MKLKSSASNNFTTRPIRNSLSSSRCWMRPSDYAIPYRKGISETGSGQKRVNKAFDQTAIVGAFRFAGRLWQDLVSEEMFRLAPGDILPDDVKNELRPQLETYTSIITGMASNGEFDNSFHEMALDLSAGTGAMYIQEGEDTDTPARFVAVPIDELRLLKGGHGDIRGIFWDRKWDAWGSPGRIVG